MSVSNVSIANLALTFLSTARIASLTEDSENARKMNTIFAMTRDSMLGDHNWNFARGEATLALTEITPATGDWINVFQLPNDCLRVLRTAGDYEFRIYEDKLYTNVSDCVIEYQKKITDPTIFTLMFVRAFAMRLAADLAFGITQNATLAEGMEKKAVQALKEAKWSDAQEGLGTRVRSGSLLESR